MRARGVAAPEMACKIGDLADDPFREARTAFSGGACRIALPDAVRRNFRDVECQLDVAEHRPRELSRRGTAVVPRPRHWQRRVHPHTMGRARATARGEGTGGVAA